MKKDNLIFSDDARDGIMNGVKKCARAVGITLGTAGRNSLIETFENPGFMATNDGFSILKKIDLADPLERMGWKILMSAVDKANKSSGDGSSTTTVLTAAILEEGMKHLGESTPMDIMRSLEDCIPLIEDHMENHSKSVSPEDIWKVAAISAEDEEIGKKIGEIYEKIGKDGIIQWEAARVPTDSYTIGTGIKMEDAGYITPYLNDIDPSTGQILSEAKAKDVPCILVRDKISSGTAFNQIFSELHERGDNDVVIFCDEITPEAVGGFINTRGSRGFRVILVKMPVLWGEEWWEDVSVATGGKIVSKQTGLNILNLQYEDVGRLGNIIVKKDSVYMDGLKDMTLHIANIVSEGTDDAKLRVARLNMKTARYFVGGYSDSSISYRRLKVEDAINAASEALDGGVVAGGGVALRDMGQAFSTGKESIGKKILSNALKVPFETILNNAGMVDENNRESSYVQDEGIDTRTNLGVNMFEEGIIDPKKVVLSAVKSAISVAASILTHGTVVLMPEQDPQAANPANLIMR